MVPPRLTLSDYLYHLMSVRDHYLTDLEIDRRDIFEYVKQLDRRKRNGENPLAEVEEKSKQLWKELIVEATNQLIHSIDTRKTRGAEFATIKLELQEILNELPYTDAGVRVLQSTYVGTLRERREQIKEKIEIEKYNTKRFWLGAALGFISGIIISLFFALFF